MSGTVKSGEGAPGASQRLEELLTEWLLATEDGLSPKVQDYLARLHSIAEREQFLDLVDQVAFADRRLPVRLRANVVLGGRYELLESIGSGGMGRVWRARDQKLQVDVAVKVLSLAAAATFDVDRMVAREGRLLARLSHPGIVRVLDTGSDGDHRYLVMELVGGQALDQLVGQLGELQQRRTPTGDDLLQLVGPAAAGRTAVVAAEHDWPTAATRVMVELLRTLEAAHGVGVVHRDLKPANVRVVGGGVPVQLDFGIGFVAGAQRSQMTAAMFGSAQYAAPEQWDSERPIDQRTDVYQAGLVAYELFTFRRCFPYENSMQLMRAIRDQVHARPCELQPGLPVELERCVLRAMEAAPERRYPTATAFREDLERWLAGRRPQAAQPFAGAGWRLRQFGRRHRHALVIGSAAVVAASAGFLLYPVWSRVAITKVDERSARADRQSVATAMWRIQRDGEVLFAPASLPGADVAGVLTCAAGQVLVIPVEGRPQGEVQLWIRAADAADRSGVVDLRALGRSLVALGRELERQDVDALPADLARQLLEGGRGASSHELPVDRLLSGEDWFERGIQSIVLQP